MEVEQTRQRCSASIVLDQLLAAARLADAAPEVKAAVKELRRTVDRSSLMGYRLGLEIPRADRAAYMDRVTRDLGVLHVRADGWCL